MSLPNKVTQLGLDVDILKLIVHGGPTDVVQTEGGPVKSIANVIAGAEATLAELAALAPELNQPGGAGKVVMSDGRTVQVTMDALYGDIQALKSYIGEGLSTTNIAEGTRAYFTNARALAASLEGLSLVNAAAVANGDSILVALGKLQKQLNNMTTALNGATRRVGDVFISARGSEYQFPAWLQCDGATYLRASYPQLAALIGGSYPTKRETLSVMGAPTNNVRGVAWSPDSAHMAVARFDSPYIHILMRSGASWIHILQAGGGDYPGRCVAFSPDGVYFAAGRDTISTQLWKRSGNTYTMISGPAGTSANGAYAIPAGLAFSPDGMYLACAPTSGQRMSIFKRSGDVFTALATVEAYSTTDFSSFFGCEFSKDGQHLAICTSSGVFIMKRTGDVFTKLISPLGTSSQARGCSYSNDGSLLVIPTFLGGKVGQVFKRDGDQYTLIQTLTPQADAGNGYTCAFSASGEFLAVGQWAPTGNFLSMYKRDGDLLSLLPKLEYPQNIQPNALAFSPDGNNLAVGTIGGSSEYYGALAVYSIGFDQSKLFRVPTFQGTVPAFIKT